MRTYPEYSSTDSLQAMIDAIKDYMAYCVEKSSDWPAALDEFEASNSVSLMTIHKSKGLEFEGVVLAGLDQSQWSNFGMAEGDDWEVVFVAISRAKSRLVVTSSDARGGPKGLEKVYAIFKDTNTDWKDFRSSCDD